MPRPIKLLCLWLCLGLSGSLMAADKPCKLNTIVRIYEALVIHTIPSWVPDGIACRHQADLMIKSKFERQQDGPVFSITLAPQGQNFTNWKQLYSLIGSYDHEKKISLEHFVKMSNAPFKKFCKKGYYRQAMSSDQKGQFNVEIQCGRFKSFENHHGYQENMGEVAIFKFIKYKNTLIKVCQEWRGSQFNPSEKSTWPITQKAYNLMLKRLNGVQAISPTIRK